MALYVNGVLQNDSATLSGGFDADGAAQVGRRMWASAYHDNLDGQVDDVRIYPYIPPVSELVEAASPLPPTITFPDGDEATAGGTLRVRFDAGGDTNVTSFNYSAGSSSLDEQVAADVPGGTATVDIPVSSVGDLSVFATGVDTVGHESVPAEVSATVVGDPKVTGVVYDAITREPVAGATVILDQAQLEIVSEPDGSYTLEAFESGTYTLAAHLGGQCGMATATEIELGAPVTVELWLVPAKDRFGYECQEAPGTPFQPLNGSALALTGDDAVEAVTIPFDFPFYGEDHTTAWVDTNGIISFAAVTGSHPYDGRNLPAPAAPGALIAPYWADLVVDSEASVLTESAGSAPYRTLSVEWRNVHLKGDSAARLTFQVTLYENGHIFMNYSGLDDPLEQGQTAAVGVESPGGQVGVQYAFKQSALSDDGMIVFPYPQNPQPITTATLSGTVVDAVTGQPMADIDVLLDPAEISVETNQDGEFTFPDLEWGTYQLEAHAGMRCGKHDQALVELEASSQVQLALQPATDEYGYTCAAGSQSFAPVSTELALSGDDSNESVTLPFDFTLYGESYDEAWVNTNGLLIFQPQPFPWWAVHDIPSVHESPSAAIYGLWSDWEVDASASVWTGVTGSAPDREFVVEWRNVRHVQDTSARVSFQVRLSESTDEITVAWDDIGTEPIEQGSLGVVGIENTDGTIALPHSTFEAALASGEGVVFTPGDPGLHVVTGTVTCADTAVDGAEVRLADQSTTTDGDGEFTFQGVPPGPDGVVVTADTGDCAGSVTVPVMALRGEPQHVDVTMVEVAEAPGYTVTVTDTTMLAAPSTVTLPGYDSGDDEYTEITPPFPVELYGDTFSQAWLDTNGYLMFEDRGYSDALPFSIPSDTWSPDSAVYPFWNDWVVDSLASVRTGVHGSAPNRQWVVEWRDVHPYNMWQRVSFQIVFDEATGQITFNYDDIGPTFVERGGAGLAGLENADGTTAVEFSHLTPVLRSGRGLVFTPVGP